MGRARLLYRLTVDLGFLDEADREATLERYREALRDMPHLGFLDWAFIFHVLTPRQVDEVTTRFEETPLKCAACDEMFFGAHVDLVDDGLPCPNCGAQHVSVADDISEWRARVLEGSATTPQGIPISPIPGRALVEEGEEDETPAGNPEEPSFDDFANGLEPGKRVGSCIVEEFVARGGMGMIYRARHTETGEVVALKVLHTRLTSNETLTLRFREEARALAALDSPHIVRVHEHGELAKHGYLLMEWVEGESLAQRMHRLGQVGVREALDAAQQTCHALEVAHAHGIIHRDVKPDNILITQAGPVKLVDFGLSKNTRSDMRLSQAGTYVGTPAYVAPEQLGQQVTPLADVYALACSLYHVLTGWLPFQGQDTAEVLQKHLQEPFPQPSVYNPRIPASLDELLMRMAQKKPAHRPQSVGEVAETLGRILEELDRTPRPSRRPMRRPHSARGHEPVAMQQPTVAEQATEPDARAEPVALEQRETKPLAPAPSAPANRAANTQPASRQAPLQATRNKRATRKALPAGAKKRERTQEAERATQHGKPIRSPAPPHDLQRKRGPAGRATASTQTRTKRGTPGTKRRQTQTNRGPAPPARPKLRNRPMIIGGAVLVVLTLVLALLGWLL